MATFDADLQREFQKLREIDENLSSMNARRRTFDRERGVGGDREAAGDDAPATRRSTTTDDGGGRRSIDDSRHTRITVTGLGVRRRITTEDDDGDRRRSLTVVSDPNSSRRIVMGGGRTDSSFALKRRRDPADEDVEEDSERPPKRSLASTVVMPTIETKSRAAAIEELKGSEKKEVSQRNRRLFGNLLMGTLKRFQSDEKKVSTQEKVQAEKQQEVERRLEEQRQQEREAALNKRKELLNARRQQEILIKQLQRKKALTQYAEQRKEHYRRLRNFIQTSTKPAIFYLPAKHTLRTLELQKETAKMLDELIEKRQKELESNLAPGEEKAGGEGETGATVKSFVARRNSREEDEDEDDYSDNERDVSRASGANGEEEAEVDEGKVEKVVVVGEEENSKDEPMDAKDDEASSPSPRRGKLTRVEEAAGRKPVKGRKGQKRQENSR